MNRYPTLTGDAAEHLGESGIALLQSLLQRFATERRMAREQHQKERRMSLVAMLESRLSTMSLNNYY